MNLSRLTRAVSMASKVENVAEMWSLLLMIVDGFRTLVEGFGGKSVLHRHFHLEQNSQKSITTI
jgi:hypothetical protein